jgi:hypothetical protein
MPTVTIEGVEEKATPGNLNAHLKGNKLLLPKDLARVLREQGVRTAEDLMSYMQSFPSGVAETLHWSMQDVSRATARLRSELRGRVGQDFLQPSRRPNPPLGARDPDDLP